MDRQLKRTACSGTDRQKARRRPRQRHDKACGARAALADHTRGIVVGGRSDAAADRLQTIPVWPVPPVDQATAVARLAGVPGIDQNHGDTLRRRLVLDPASLRDVAVEAAPGPLVASLLTVRDPGNAADSSLGGNPEAPAQRGAAKPVQSVLPARRRLLCQAGKPVAGGAAGVQPAPQQIGLIGGGQQPHGRRELHRSDTLPRFDETSHDSVRDSADRASTVASVPECRQPTGKVGIFAAQDAAGSALEPADDPSNRGVRVGLDEEMHMVCHRRRVKGESMHYVDVTNDLLEVGIEGINQLWLVEFPAEDNEDSMARQAENRPEVHSIAPARSLVASRVEFKRRTPIRPPVLPCQLKQAVSKRSFL
jgi:hypothetical protein